MRFLEINHEGMAFHEPSFDHPFSTGEQVPPREVIFCDCAGVGRICHHTYPNGHEVEVHGHTIKGMVRHPEDPDRLVPQVSQENFKKTHGGKRCKHRRQFFVNVTYRPDAKVGMRYDEATDTFSEV